MVGVLVRKFESAREAALIFKLKPTTLGLRLDSGGIVEYNGEKFKLIRERYNSL